MDPAAGAAGDLRDLPGVRPLAGGRGALCEVRAETRRPTVMSDVIDLKRRRVTRGARRAFRNWKNRFKEDFDLDARLSGISMRTLCFLARGREDSTFYLYDLIMNVLGTGSGFEFNLLESEDKMRITDRYLFLLDQVRYECMRRLGWIKACPGEVFTIVELIEDFDSLAPSVHAGIPKLAPSHPRYEEFTKLTAFEKESFIRGLIPAVLRELEGYSSTL